MADISDDEVIEKPKRVMSDKQKEALKKGRELAKMNRAAQKPKVSEPSSSKVAEVKPETKKRVKKVKEETKEVENMVVAPPPSPVEVPSGKRISRKPKVEEPVEPVSPLEEKPAPVKKTRTARAKKTEEPSQPQIAQPKPIRQKPSLQFV